MKKNFVEVLRRELDRPSWKRDYVAVRHRHRPSISRSKGTTSSRAASLEALAHARTPAGLITKGPMAVRDKDVLAELARRARCTVYFSVPTVDEEAWRALEPGTAHPLQRLRAVRELNDAGVRTRAC